MNQVLQLADRLTSLSEIEDLLSSVQKDQFLLLLLVENGPTKVKSGLPSLVNHVMKDMTAKDGDLDLGLRGFAAQRRSVNYRRLLLDRTDTASLTKLGTCWLPQVRLIRNHKVAFRSSVALGDNGKFLAQDVGGRSFIRRTSSPTPFLNLLDALAAEVDRRRL